MADFIFNETNIFILSKLVALLKRADGKRYKLNTENNILDLVRGASEHKGDEIEKFYIRFVDNLTPEQISILLENNIDVPKDHIRKPGIFPTNIKRQYAYIPNQS